MNKGTLFFALGIILFVSNAVEASDLKFYCDIDQGYNCRANRCELVEQTVYPARYRFSLDVEKGVGVFRSCPGDDCGQEWPLKVLREADGSIVAIYGSSPEIFNFSPDLRSYQYVWRSRNPNHSEGRHKGRCFR